jgi:predicted nucleic acid-binding protein
LQVSKLLAVNSSPLILLGRISRLDLLPAIAERVVIPHSVLGELSVKDGTDWLATTVTAIPGFEIVDDSQIPATVARWDLGAGESAVLAYCLLNPGYRAVLDDQKGRRCARSLGVALLGTLGVVVEARRQGLIPVARPIVAAIRGAGYYIEDELIAAALQEIGEDW